MSILSALQAEGKTGVTTFGQGYPGWWCLLVFGEPEVVSVSVGSERLALTSHG